MDIFTIFQNKTMTAPSVTIRPYRPADQARVIETMRLNVPVFFAESEVHDLQQYLENEIETYFVAEVGGVIVGAGGINTDYPNKTGKISWDFIDPAFQGKGVGRQLLQHRIRILQATEHIETISVRTSQAAYRFYEKNGFVLKNTAKDYWAEGLDLYEMQYGGQQ